MVEERLFQGREKREFILALDQHQSVDGATFLCQSVCRS